MEQKGIRFIKMEGAGNDYIYVDCFEQEVLNPSAFTRRVSDRHFGIGGDGVIFMRHSPRADCFMDIYNADGSRGRTCGNGLRCVAWYIYRKLGMTRKRILVETLSGVRECYIAMAKNKKAWVQVDMGCEYVKQDVDIYRREIARCLPSGLAIANVVLVDVGNLHCVIFVEKSGDENCSIMEVDLEALGVYMENCDMFPEGINVEVCLSDDIDDGFLDGVWCRHTWRVRVWERGAGETYACGSGACAVYIASGCTSEAACIFMNGGRLTVEKDEKGHVLLSGEAVDVFCGCIF